MKPLRRAFAPALTALALLAFAPAAHADISFGPPGTGAGELSNPRDLAIKDSTGEVFVTEQGRISVFDEDGDFLRAFGWGVDTGAGQLETCTAASGCQAGFFGSGGGQFGANPGHIAVDNEPTSPAFGDVFVIEANRVQRLSFDDNGTPGDPADDFAVFDRSWGWGVVSGGATATGDLTAGSTAVTGVQVTSRFFHQGQTITGTGIPAGTRIVGLGNGTITLSQPATSSGAGVMLTAPTGAGNDPVNEVQTYSVASGNKFAVQFRTPNPSPSHETSSSSLPGNASVAAVQQAFNDLANVEPGDITVSGSPGDYTFTFGGRFPDTNLSQVIGTVNGGGLSDFATVQDGGATPELCTASSGDDCAPGIVGFGPGQFTSSTIALGDGTVLVADNGPDDYRVQAFDPDGTLTGQPLTDERVGNFLAIATDAAGDFYLGGSNLGTRKYDQAGACLAFCAAPLPAASNGIAIERTSGEILIPVFAGSGLGSQVNRYDSAGNQLSAAFNEEMNNLDGIAARSTPDGDFYATRFAQSGDQVVHVPFPPPGPLVLPVPPDADPLGNTSATLTAYANPEGEATTYHLEYLTAADYAANGDSFTGPNPATSTPETAVGSDFTTYELETEVTGLIPETTYHVRAVATDGVETDTGPEGTFTTREPFEFGDAYSTEVGTDSAILHAELNPLGIPATGYFEYVTEAEYQADGFDNADKAPDVDSGAAPLDFGDAQDELVLRSAQAQGLQPDTAYRFRFVAENVFETESGPERQFHTFAPPDPFDASCPNNSFRQDLPSAHLPDCRAYERVSPADKGGGDIDVANTLEGTDLPGFVPARLSQAAPGGEKLTYSSVGAFADPEGVAWSSQYIASRDPAQGWLTENVTPPRRIPPLYAVAATFDPPFTSFTEDLCTGFVRQETDFPLDPADNAGFVDLYRRDNCGPDAGAYELLTTVAPPNQNGTGVANNPPYVPRVQGYSADGQIAVFRANDELTFDASTATDGGGNPIYQTYIHTGTSLRLVSVLPSPGGTTLGAAAELNSSVGDYLSFIPSWRQIRSDVLENAVSADGGRVYWEMRSIDGETADTKLYLRVNPASAPSPVSGGQCTNPARACTYPVSETIDPGSAEFEAATPDGSKALFRFGGGAHARELYRYDAQTQTPTLIAAGLQGQGILGASTDLSRVYFASDQVLDAGATSGARNLYLHTEGEGHRFIATLSDSLGAELISLVNHRYDHAGRVSPDGAHAVFLSTASLTGYQSIDADGGWPAMQVFAYDAEADGGAGELHCVSCNPSGARPESLEAKVIFGADPYGFAALIPGYEYDLHASRVLSADGSRLYFESWDSLLPADVNGAKDVYQWQKAGTGSCDAQDANHFPQNGGCLDLISTGQNAQDTKFVDASADGSDVFITSDERLWGGDFDDLVDIYDARVGGGFAAPPPPDAGCDLSAGACEGEGTDALEGQGAASAQIEGAGNVIPDRCAPLSRKVRALSRQAKRLRARAKRTSSAARRSSKPRRARSLRRKAARQAGAARKRARAARKGAARERRCRSAARRASR